RNIGGMNLDRGQKAIGDGDDMPLAPADALAGIVAPGTAGLGRWCALTVDNRCRWPGLAPELLAGSLDQSCGDFLPSSGIAPGVKITLNRRIRRKLLRQGTPLAACGQNVENRLQNLAKTHFPRPAQPRPPRKPP